MPPLNPLLESDSVECAHKGKVLFQSTTKDLMCVENAGMISLQDLANATIIGCTNNIAGFPSPCTKLVNIPNSIASTLLEIDNQKIVLVQAISQVLTDKGSPLILQGEPKAKDIFEIDEDIVENVQNTQNNNAKSTSESSGDSNESNAESNAKSSKDSSDSQSTQDSQSQKEILEIYFSYGEEMVKLESNDSRHSSDMNLHIVTSGYENGEEVEIKLNTKNDTFTLKANVENNQAVIKNITNIIKHRSQNE